MILSFLTNLLIDALHEDCADGDIQHALSDLLTGEGGVFQFCASFPEVRMFWHFQMSGSGRPGMQGKGQEFCRHYTNS